MIKFVKWSEIKHWAYNLTNKLNVAEHCSFRIV